MNKIFWWTIAGVVVLIAIASSVNQVRKQEAMPTPYPSVSVNPAPSITAGITPVGGAGSNNPPTPGTSNQSYTSLVAQYGSNRIQFDKYCQAIPNYGVFKAGTKVMFDNRSGDARVITIGGVKYNFPGYGYRIIRLGGPVLPATVKLDCGAARNVGTIIVEK